MRWIEEGSRGDSNGWGIAPFGSGGALRRRQATTTGRREAEMACVSVAWPCMAADWAAVGGQREMDRIGGKEQLTSQLMKTSPIYNLQPLPRGIHPPN